ncbi:inactive tyrosine-protein kinase transmembrane receptor ROR1-like [Uloborus diversus]|uniref:inactive tyrosine-protein kinase transmembrane receptor ROR1-like n=1 Tax=Uloborus diversus TaxID=327109 RepID=UPI002409261B|nr:inactive tyrosine-protein kinase transmembrane receptor ROR1-like [Uloborus diversus]
MSLTLGNSNENPDSVEDENSTGGVLSVGDLRLERSLSNLTRETGDSVKLRCDVRLASPTPHPIHFRWYKNEAPVEEERGRVEIRRYNPGPGRTGSRLRIARLDIHDTGYYKCEAGRGEARVESTGILMVRAGRLQPPAAIPNFPPVFPHFPALGGS